MPARLYLEAPLSADAELALPAGAARHVQVLRLQPGEFVTLFNGQGGEWQAEILRMGRQSVEVRVVAHDPVERELPIAVTLVAGMPANDRFDWLIEKATELGAMAIEPVVCERSVLRLSGERAERKREHWQAVAVAAAEQSGRTRVPTIAPVRTLPQAAALAAQQAEGPQWLLSLAEAVPMAERLAQDLRASGGAGPDRLRVYSGPEGGFSAAEEALVRGLGARAVGLGARVLRSETAPLAVLAALGLVVRPPSGQVS
ncbi:16S rRNA (uracil(1498)-N(3))-methyltransferase [Sphaerotilus sp.]|uniref:16S rRNA (uracil(1498)-N(3))-methyltransferase n=1 Tax=Sphaerotilus sp. TaxID=2093942 RepID=UPI002ACDFF86|nr:16S rRNA (uracil(1498)-N(3))-methyltransferase [Sphaerotilus sp.]MDZ7857112.1 16S rRNA (uracil(1498)-N(3))-methyltransferase [Sphaerotilus sp.]